MNVDGSHGNLRGYSGSLSLLTKTLHCRYRPVFVRNCSRSLSRFCDKLQPWHRKFIGACMGVFAIAPFICGGVPPISGGKRRKWTNCLNGSLNIIQLKGEDLRWGLKVMRNINKTSRNVINQISWTAIWLGFRPIICKAIFTSWAC